MVIIGFSTGCEKEENLPFTRGERKLIDSIYSTKVGAVRQVADSICEKIYPEVFEAAKDSIKARYISEITEILESEN